MSITESESQEKLEGIEYCHPSLQRKFVEILLNELTSLDISDKGAYIFDIYCFLNKFSSIYFDVINQNFDSLNKLKKLINEFNCIESILKPILFVSFEKLYKGGISWNYEMDIEPIARHLRIVDKIPFSYPTNSDYLKRDRYPRLSDREFEEIKQEFDSFLHEEKNKHILSVGISYSYANITLPKVYEVIFDCNDWSKFWERKVIVKYAFNFRVLFHTDLWRGHHSHCIIEIIGDIPPVFDELPVNGNGEHTGIGICTKYDWQYIKNRRLY